MKARKLAGALLGSAMIVALVGCGDAKDAQIQALQERNMGLERERADLKSQLDKALGDSDAASRRALDLQRMLDEAQGTGRDPSLPANWTGNENIAWTDISDDILFDSGRATLKASGRAKLQEVVRQIQTSPTLARREIWVVGHTDTDPINRTKDKWQDNLDLSANRAMTVVREFWNMGLDRRRVVAAGQGEFNPRSSNNNKSGKAMNRRVQIIAVTRPPMDSGGEPQPLRRETAPARSNGATSGNQG